MLTLGSILEDVAEPAYSVHEDIRLRPAAITTANCVCAATSPNNESAGIKGLLRYPVAWAHGGTELWRPKTCTFNALDFVICQAVDATPLLRDLLDRSYTA
jgi:hypothetical protein